MEAIKRKARSPYQRYNKRPYMYSEEHRKWIRAVKERDDRGQNAAHREWERKFGLTRREQIV